MMKGIENKEGLGKFVNDADSAKARLAKLLIQGAQDWRELYDDIPFSGQTDSTKESKALIFDLRLRTLEFLLANTFREPTVEERGILDQMGYDIVLSTEAKPLSLVVVENQDHFRHDELSFVNAKDQLRDYVPPALAVVLRSKQLFLADSFLRSQFVQLKIVEKESQLVQAHQLPNARAIMLPASVEAQIDLAHLQTTGKVLFEDRFTRALDETSGDNVAGVGRNHSDGLLVVDEWVGHYPHNNVGVLSAVVFIQK